MYFLFCVVLLSALEISSFSLFFCENADLDFHVFMLFCEILVSPNTVCTDKFLY